MRNIQSKADRINLKQRRDSKLHAWQKPNKVDLAIRKSKQPTKYEVFNDEGVLLGFLFTGR
jgi:hypothetical protein